MIQPSANRCMPGSRRRFASPPLSKPQGLQPQEASMRHLYSHALGIEPVDDAAIADLDEGHATVVYALLVPGRTTAPTAAAHIEVIYCPRCGRLDPSDEHDADCPHEGIVLI